MSLRWRSARAQPPAKPHSLGACSVPTNHAARSPPGIHRPRNGLGIRYLWNVLRSRVGVEKIPEKFVPTNGCSLSLKFVGVDTAGNSNVVAQSRNVICGQRWRQFI